MNKWAIAITNIFILAMCLSWIYSPAHSSLYIFNNNFSEKNFSGYKLSHIKNQPGIGKNFISILRKTINKITYKITQEEIGRGTLLNTLIPVLSIVIILQITASILLFFSVFIIKTRRLVRKRRKKEIGKAYLLLIANYLVDVQQYEYPVFPKLYNRLNRTVLIEHVYNLSKNLFGKKHNKLLKLFRIRRLLRHVLFQITISGKARKATYLKLFSHIILNQALLYKFHKYLFSKHHELRRFAQLSMLNYDIDSLGEILQDYRYYLTTWDQIHFLEVIERRATIPPDFYIYLQSSNPTVVIFGLRMIRIFYQKSDKETLIGGLLGHPNEEVKHEALKTASELKVEGIANMVLAYLSEIENKYKYLVVEYLIKSNKLDDTMLYKFLLNEKDDVNQMNILTAIYNNDPNGKAILEDLKNYTKEESIRSMCTCILENTL